MLAFDDLAKDMQVLGIIPTQAVTLVSVDYIPSAQAAHISYRTADGQLHETILFRDQARTLTHVARPTTWNPALDGNLLRLVLEAQRIKLAYLFDSRLAVHVSQVEPLPHQITAVYTEMVPRQPLRYILADDPGAGKTIMAGLLIKELMLREDVKRCLIVTPGSLVEQWQDELEQRFQLHFRILTRDAFDQNPLWFQEQPFVLARLDHLSRNESMQRELQQCDWDLVIVDEAHKMAASFFSGDVSFTKRYELGRLLSSQTRHFLLLTATPHNGKEEDFQLFLALLDADRFEGRFRTGVHTVDTSDLMRRLVKEQLLRFDGTPLFPERIATTVSYQLSAAEALLYDDITTYVRQEFDRADALANGGRKTTVGFALTILQRRLASSPAAVYQSLRRRRERLQRRLQDHLSQRADLQQTTLDWDSSQLLDAAELDDLAGDEQEAQADALVDQASAAQTITELQREIERLGELEQQAAALLNRQGDTKWDQVSQLLQTNTELRDEHGRMHKLVVFTEHRDTLSYLVERIRGLLGRPEAVVAIHGGVSRAERLANEAAFREHPDVVVLVATDAAGEGINLQRAHLMINYDLPWNPNRLEQRFGRIHRIGQREVCHVWNLVAANTREGAVYERLLSKLATERSALGGQVFNVLGKLSFDQQPLRELLLEAIRYGDQPAVRERLDRAVDMALDRQHLQALLQERALTSDVFDQQLVQNVREEMEQAAAQRLQPHFIAAFFRAAFQQLGGSLREREQGRLEVMHVPQPIRNEAQATQRAALAQQYARITFEKNFVQHQRLDATLITPGHPLLDSTLNLLLHKHRDLLHQGGVLVDPTDLGLVPRVLFVFDHAIRNGRHDVVSRRIQFVEISENGAIRHAGSAPYLDYRALTPQEQALVAQASWQLDHATEQAARMYAIQHLLQEHLAQMQATTQQRIQRVRRAVHERLTKEIFYWDQRSVALEAEERRGRNPKVNSLKARQRVTELEQRLTQRNALLDQEAQLNPSPPSILCQIMVVPTGWLLQHEPQPQLAIDTADHNRQVELRAMAAVMQHVRSHGYEPVDVSHEKRGYDVLATHPHLPTRFFEVKGRTNSSELSLTRNEVLAALNTSSSWRLALVDVPSALHQACAVRYLAPFFNQDRDFAETSRSYRWQTLWDQAHQEFDEAF
ncbi:helicase-related protein [Herpetosiphon sp. NSE202]|uniref:helicase-related protein n=1 Tax=Herpetosiphon sp. NSE202 TaxID=3351349 RepID=UPI0036420B56